MSNKSVEEFLGSKTVVQTNEIVELLGCSKRSLCRWQDDQEYVNPMPRPYAIGRGIIGGNRFDSAKILEWYQSLPLQKKSKAQLVS